jgi:hypothetical protein
MTHFESLIIAFAAPFWLVIQERRERLRIRKRSLEFFKHICG